MVVTRDDVASAILKYTNHEVTLKELVDWAENSMMEADFESGYHDVIRDVVARIGLADAEEFGLTWDDCYDFLHKLGYSVKVMATQSKP